MKFYPFNLTGLQFLVFYGELILVVFVLLAIAFRIMQMRGIREDPHLTDPYAIAMLRAGPAEAVRIAMMSLIDRSLLRIDGDNVVAHPDAHALVRRPLEKAIVVHFRRASNDEPEAVASHALVAPHVNALRLDLVAGRLLSDPLHPSTNPCFAPALLALLVLGIVALVRIKVSGPPFTFLVVLGGLAAIVILIGYARRSTPLGRRTLRQLQTLFKRLRARANTLRAGGQTNEATLLAAVFGLNALPESSFNWLERLRARKGSNSSSCGSSCGSSSSSSSCGGGSGGGGCGGGCGGGD